MSAAGSPMKWWGWGDPARRIELGTEALGTLRAELGKAEPAVRPALEEVALPAARPVPKAVVDAVGPDAVLSGAEERLRRAAGRGYPDLVRLRSGRLDEAPDAVVLPGSSAEVARVLEACARERIAVVPFGGGTSVVGGVDPAAPGFDCLISLDLGRMVEVSVDRRSLTATLARALEDPMPSWPWRSVG